MMTDREKIIKELQGLSGSKETMRLISDAIALLKEQEDLGTELTNAVELIHKKNERIEKLLKEQEPKTGKWILDDEDANSWECSECGALQQIIDGTPYENGWYFCPHCGTKLEEHGCSCRAERAGSGKTKKDRRKTKSFYQMWKLQLRFINRVQVLSTMWA